MTLRDQVWNAVLEQLRKTAQFKISALPFGESQRHTVRRVLRNMEKMGLLYRENNRAAIWRIGDAAIELLNVHPDKVKQARPDFTY